jgi:Uma2 family endonuclease
MPPRIADAGDQKIVIRGVAWNVYDCLSQAIGDDQHVRLAFDGEDLEIMTTGYPHEQFKEILGKFVAAVSKALGIPRKTAGETTWKRPTIERGIQADQCYYFRPDKLAAAKAAWSRSATDIADYPNPDLAVEIDLSDPKIDREDIYAKLQVTEIWRFDGETLRIEQLQDDGTYKPAEKSLFLPVTPAHVLQWLTAEDYGDELAWERRLDAWAKTLRPKKSKER